MFFAAVVVQALLATASFAIPTSRERFARRIARRSSPRQPSANLVTLADATEGEYSNNWAGAVYNANAGTWKSVTATFIVPTPKKPSSESGTYSASAWVGIDGDSCQQSILQTGVDFNADDAGVSYDAWYEWFPDYAYDFRGINFAPGDNVTLTVTASSTTSGTAVIKNNSNGQVVTQNLENSVALCEQDAEWIIEDFEDNDALVPFADFGSVTFDGAVALGKSGSVGPGNAIILDIQQNGQVLTSSSVTASSVTVKYI